MKSQAIPFTTMSISRDECEEQHNVFEHLAEPVESVQDYVPGGLHPVYLGDTVEDGRYTILRKLGYGGYSTVWLAQDNKHVSFPSSCLETLLNYHQGEGFVCSAQDCPSP